MYETNPIRKSADQIHKAIVSHLPQHSSWSRDCVTKRQRPSKCAVNGYDIPSKTLELSSADIHVWWAFLDLPRDQVQRLARALSADERLRAGRFLMERHRTLYRVGRGILRIILSRYLGIAPDKLCICYERAGKPVLALSHGSALRFNVSHSQNLAVYAVTSDRQIGIDLEYLHPIAGIEQIVEQFFSTREKAMFRSLPISERVEGFFNCWTRKEAFVKACGNGLTRSLSDFDVSLIPGEPVRLLSIQGNSQEAARWSLHQLVSVAGYVAALAVEGHGWRLTSWQWPDSACSC